MYSSKQVLRLHVVCAGGEDTGPVFLQGGPQSDEVWAGEVCPARGVSEEARRKESNIICQSKSQELGREASSDVSAFVLVNSKLSVSVKVKSESYL